MSTTKRLDTCEYHDIVARLEREQAEQEHHGLETIAATCQQLAALGITKIHIAYDGCGDSGAVETVVGFAGDSAVDLPKAIEDILAEAAEELLPGGWEINDGSFGELVVDVAGRKLTREHSWRVSETEYEEMEFELDAPDPAEPTVDDVSTTGHESVEGDEGDECDTDDEVPAREADRQTEDTVTIRVVVACTNAGGEPDFAFVKIRCRPQQRDADEHCLAAQDWAADNDYEGPFVVFDEFHVAGKQLLESFQWDSAAVIDLARH